MVETEVEPHTAWATEQTGVWIDLFPIDGISDNRDEFITRANEIRSVENKLFEARGKKDKISRNRSFMFNLKKIAKKIVFRGYDIKALQEQYYNLLPITDFETSKNCGMLRFPNAIEKEFIPTYIYKDYILTDFCDTQLMVIKRYDEFLRYFYGDYMKYPPIEQRQPLHSDHLYFWKKKNQ
jgi:lipopolysaccharide cholinephosphotransferase